MPHLEAETASLPRASESGRVVRGRLSHSKADERAWVVPCLVMITLAAFALRLIAAQQTLFGDELNSYAALKGPSFPNLLGDTTSPPLWTILAWFGARLGDPLTSIRWPSVIATSAAVPIIYLIGDEIAGRRAGIFAAAFFAVTPFAVFYGSEARPYGLLIFLVVVSTLALLRALEAKDARRWWALYWFICVLVLFTHYTGGIAIALQGAWALLSQPGRRKAIVAVNAAIFLPFLPWIPQLDNNTSGLISNQILNPLTTENVLTDPLRIVFGHPYAPFNAVPGLFSIVLTSLAGALIVVGLLRPELLCRIRLNSPSDRRSALETRARRSGASGVHRSGWLLLFMTAGTLLATLIYSEVADVSIWSARHTITVLPYFCLIIGVAVAALRGRATVVAGIGLMLAALLGSARMLAQYPRPDVHAAADAIANRAPPGTPVAEPWPYGHRPGAPETPQTQGLSIYLDDRYPIIRPEDAGDWPRGRVVYGVGGASYPPTIATIARSAGARPVKTITFDGWPQVTLTRYGAVGRPVVPGSAAARASSLGIQLQQNPQALHDYLEAHPSALRAFQQELRARQAAP